MSLLTPLTWAYADENDIIDAIETDNLIVLSNQNNTSSDIDHNRVQRAGFWADAEMNNVIGKVYSLPLTGLTADETQLLKSISVNLVLWKMKQWRTFVSPESQVNTAFSGMRAEADRQLLRIAMGVDRLSTPGLTSVAWSPATNEDARNIDGERVYPKKRFPFVGWPGWF